VGAHLAPRCASTLVEIAAFSDQARPAKSTNGCVGDMTLVAPAGFEPAISASPGARRAHFLETAWLGSPGRIRGHGLSSSPSSFCLVLAHPPRVGEHDRFPFSRARRTPRQARRGRHRALRSSSGPASASKTGELRACPGSSSAAKLKRATRSRSLRRRSRPYEGR
jgi:hypothetical protein